MNAPVIASQLTEAVRRLSPSADIHAVASGNQITVTLTPADALAIVDFVEDHSRSRTTPSPEQRSLFDQDA